MTFEEVVQYLHSLVGHEVQVNAWPDKVAEVGVHLAGTVSAVHRSNIGPRSRPTAWRYFCQVGEQPGNGFFVSPLSFRRASIGLIDPETWGLFILMEGGYQIAIEDARIRVEEGQPVLPV